MDSVEEALAHYGVRGMKWGVRTRSSSSSPASSAKSTTKTVAAAPASGKSSTGKPAWQSAPSKKSAKREARSEQKKPSDDAVIFNNLREKAKKGSINSLSNDEIRILTTRARVLEEYARAFPAPPKPKSKTKKVADFFIEEVLLTSGKKTLKSISDEKMKQFAIKKEWLPTPPKRQVTTEISRGED